MLFSELENQIDAESRSESRCTTSSTSSSGKSSSTRPRADGKCKVSHLIECQDEVFCCEICPSSAMVAVGTNKGIVKIYGMIGAKHLYSLVDSEVRQTNLPAVCCNWVGQEKLVVGYASGKIKLWNISNQECLHTINEDRTVLQTIVAPSNDVLITSGSTSGINIYSLPTFEKVLTCNASPSKSTMDGHRSSVYAVKHHPVDNWNFISGGWDDTVQFWDRRDEHAQRRLFGPHICGQALDINPRDNSILTASWRLQEGIQIWDYGEGKLLRTFNDSERCLYYAAQFIGHDNLIAGGSNKNVFKVKEKRSGIEIGEVSQLTGGVFCCDQSAVQARGDEMDVRVCFGFATKLAITDIKELERRDNYSNFRNITSSTSSMKSD